MKPKGVCLHESLPAAIYSLRIPECCQLNESNGPIQFNASTKPQISAKFDAKRLIDSIVINLV